MQLSKKLIVLREKRSSVKKSVLSMSCLRNKPSTKVTVKKVVLLETSCPDKKLTKKFVLFKNKLF